MVFLYLVFVGLFEDVLIYGILGDQEVVLFVFVVNGQQGVVQVEQGK